MTGINGVSGSATIILKLTSAFSRQQRRCSCFSDVLGWKRWACITTSPRANYAIYEPHWHLRDLSRPTIHSFTLDPVSANYWINSETYSGRPWPLGFVVIPPPAATTPLRHQRRNIGRTDVHLYPVGGALIFSLATSAEKSVTARPLSPLRSHISAPFQLYVMRFTGPEI